ASAVFAQAAAPAPEALSEVIVKGQALRPEDSVFSATSLDGVEIRDLARSNTDQLFREVPGMAVRDFQLAGVASAIVIRGFGNGGHGGDLGAVIDGISLNEAMSHADGYVDLNVVTPLEIEGFTVYKGPISALYGNFNRGGLVAIETRKTGTYREADAAVGSFGTVDLQAALGTGIGDRQQLNLAAQLFGSDGFRPQSQTRRGTLSGRYGVELSPAVQLALSGRYHHADSDSASYLLRSQFLVDRDGIDPRVQNDGADKDFLTVRGDVNVALTPDLKLLTYVYTTQQDFTRWYTRPVSATTWRQREESYDRSVFGIGTSLNGERSVASTTLKYVAGVETLRESTDYAFYDGLNRRQRVAAALNDRDTRLDSLSAFAEIQAPLHPLAQLSAGLRADRFTGGCERLGPETGSDPCDSLNDPKHVSPKFGMRSQWAPWLQMRASWAEGFALPNNFVKYSVGGQPLGENVFRQTEIGARIAPSDAFDLDIAAYRLLSTGEVRTVAPGQFE
ncbi:TonB-dependent receptor, partial [bacterium]